MRGSCVATAAPGGDCKRLPLDTCNEAFFARYINYPNRNSHGDGRGACPERRFWPRAGRRPGLSQRREIAVALVAWGARALGPHGPGRQERRDGLPGSRSV